MLTNVKYNEDEYEFPCLLVLGCFDAIHKGHAELLKKAKLQAKINGLDLGVMVFANGKGGSQICTFEEKLGLLEQYNVKFVLSVDFNDEFKKTKPLDFLQNIEDKLNVKAYMSGKDFRFGAGAKGKSSTLKNYGEDEDNGVWYMPVKDVTAENGEKISTTQIKELLETGDIKSANELLGRDYSLSADVVSVNENGDETVLILAYPAGKVKPAQGEYKVKCTFEGAEFEGVASCGATVDLRVANFSGTAEGDKITVCFAERIGAEESTGELNEELNGLQLETVSAEATNEAVEEMAVTDSQYSEQVDAHIEETSAEPAQLPVEEVMGAQPEEVIEEAAEVQVEEITEEKVVSATETDEEPKKNEPAGETLTDDDGFYDDYIEEGDYVEEKEITEEQPDGITEEPAFEQSAEESAETEIDITAEADEQTSEEPETDDINSTTENEEHID